MKELITMAFRQVRGIRDIFIPEEATPVFSNIMENLHEILASQVADYLLIEGEQGRFYARFSNDGWVGVTTDRDVSEVLILAALDRTARFLDKHRQIKQRIKHLQHDIEELFLMQGIAAAVREMDLSVGTDSLTGTIRVSARGGRSEAVRDLVVKFLDKQLPYFIRNKVIVVTEKQSLFERITRDQLVRIIRRVERL
ncbi:MAG: hypothetical protein HXS52_04170 [Theionarchaea archaeon]|nr:hypothetical protein [Theionarchaea archaeon]MBU7037102.1 hypothetical protein [Theionarchaea archaeon]